MQSRPIQNLDRWAVADVLAHDFRESECTAYSVISEARYLSDNTRSAMLTSRSATGTTPCSIQAATDRVALRIRVGDADRNDLRMGYLVVVEGDGDDCHGACLGPEKFLKTLSRPRAEAAYRVEGNDPPDANKYHTNCGSFKSNSGARTR